MGQYGVTFGTWMKAKPIKVKQEITLNSCCNDKCHRYNSDFGSDTVFCPKCGTKVCERTTTREEEITLAEFMYNDKGNPKSGFANLTNEDSGNELMGRAFKKQIDMENTDFQPWAKDGDNYKIDPQTEIDNFKKTYKTAIRACSKAGFVLNFYWGPLVSYN